MHVDVMITEDSKIIYFSIISLSGMPLDERNIVKCED